MADQVFKAKSLAYDEVKNAYEQSLKQVDAQRLEAHILLVMNPEVPQIKEKYDNLEKSYSRLVDDYENWKSQNKQE